MIKKRYSKYCSKTTIFISSCFLSLTQIDTCFLQLYSLAKCKSILSCTFCKHFPCFFVLFTTILHPIQVNSVFFCCQRHTSSSLALFPPLLNDLVPQPHLKIDRWWWILRFYSYDTGFYLGWWSEVILSNLLIRK